MLFPKTVKLEVQDWSISQASIENLKSETPPIDFENNPDLLGISFNGAVVNVFNQNRDGIDTELAKTILPLFINKPVNLEHFKKDITGHIVSAWFSDFETNERIEEDALPDNKPFYMSFSAVIYKIPHPELSEAIESGEMKIKASWEVAFKNADIYESPSNLLSDAKKLEGKDRDHAVELFKAFAAATNKVDQARFLGSIKKRNLYRLIQPKAYPLGMALTLRPAADVPEIIKVSDNQSLEIKKSVNSNSNLFQSNMDEEQLKEILAALNKVKDAVDQNEQVEEAQASVRDLINDGLHKVGEELIAKKNQAENQLAEANQKIEELKQRIETVESEASVNSAKYQKIDAEYQKLMAEMREKEALAKYNERMAEMDECYEMDDAMREMVAEDLKNLDEADESYAMYKVRMAKMCGAYSKEKIAEAKKREAEQLESAVAAKIQEALKLKKGNKSLEETLEEARANVTDAPPPSNGPDSTENLFVQFGKAFSKEKVKVDGKKFA